MLFHTPIYLLCFLPLVVAGYYAIGRRAGRLWLLGASALFYAWAGPWFLAVALGSVAANYRIGNILSARKERGLPGRGMLWIGIGLNLILLGYFKYAWFVIKAFPIVFPLGLSFITFKQISYLVDLSRGRGARSESIWEHALFTLFFPQLLQGPITRHAEMMPGLNEPPALRWESISAGLFLLSIGLVKKLAIADTFALWADAGFSDAGSLTLLTAWAASLSYTLQIYFDFSGYTDMALGAALMMGLRLPRNFDSPYRALSIQDFWRRWHLSLSRFLRDYIYIPLGGNRRGEALACIFVVVTFILGGIWHGAGWTFLVWGVAHGAAAVIHRIWKRSGGNMPSPIAWVITFLFINAAWVVFRAESISDAWTVLSVMAGQGGVSLPGAIEAHLGWLQGVEFGRTFDQLGDWRLMLPAIVAGLALSALGDNSDTLAAEFRPALWRLALTAMALAGGVLLMGRESAFIYFRF